MTKKFLLVTAVILAFTATSLWAADTTKAKPQTACPVMAGNVNKNLYADYKGQRVYFCCAGCVALFKKDPEKYLQKLKELGVTPEKAPAGK